jgi:hypothetical protein
MFSDKLLQVMTLGIGRPIALLNDVIYIFSAEISCIQLVKFWGDDEVGQG